MTNPMAPRARRRMPIDLFGLRARTRLARIEAVCAHTSRGIYKRIDENREDLEVLQRECPEVLDRCWWLEAHFRSLDDLRDHILAFIAYYNRTMAKPIKWSLPGRQPVDSLVRTTWTLCARC